VDRSVPTSDMHACPNCGESRPGDLSLPCLACGLYAPAADYRAGTGGFTRDLAGARILFNASTGDYTWTSPDGVDHRQSTAPTQAELEGPVTAERPDVPGLTICRHCGDQRVEDIALPCDACGMFNGPGGFVELDGGTWRGPGGVQFNDSTGLYSWPLGDGTLHEQLTAPTPDEILQIDLEGTLDQAGRPADHLQGWTARVDPDITEGLPPPDVEVPDLSPTELGPAPPGWEGPIFHSGEDIAGVDWWEYHTDRLPDGTWGKSFTWTVYGYDWVDPRLNQHVTAEMPDPSFISDRRRGPDRQWEPPAGSTETAPPSPRPPMIPQDDRAPEELRGVIDRIIEGIDSDPQQEELRGVIQGISDGLEGPPPATPVDAPLGAAAVESVTLVSMEGHGPGLPPLSRPAVTNTILEADPSPVPNAARGTAVDQYPYMLEADAAGSVIGGAYVQPGAPGPDWLQAPPAAVSAAPGRSPSRLATLIAGGSVLVVFVAVLFVMLGSQGGGSSAGVSSPEAVASSASGAGGLSQTPVSESIAPAGSASSGPAMLPGIPVAQLASTGAPGSTNPCTTVVILNFAVAENGPAHAGEDAVVVVTGDSAGTYHATVGADGSFSVPLSPRACGSQFTARDIVRTVGGQPARAVAAAAGMTPPPEPSGETPAPAAVDLCTRLTPDVAARILGAPVTIDARPGSCTATPSAGVATVGKVKFSSVSLFNQQDRAGDAYAAARSTASGLGTIEPVTGLGDKAFFGPTGLNILAGDTYLLVGSVALFDPAKAGTDAPLPVLRGFAEAVLGGG
jgi:hypothetical protein